MRILDELLILAGDRIGLVIAQIQSSKCECRNKYSGKFYNRSYS